MVSNYSSFVGEISKGATLLAVKDAGLNAFQACNVFDMVELAISLIGGLFRFC
jgi:hypothetical protein